MLTCLQIENIAVIEKTEALLSEGFIVLTGQTGAGKTLLIDSLQMILGERVSKEVIRSGCDKAMVSALFSVKESYNAVSVFCDDNGIDFDGEIIVRREIYTDGRSRAFINGNMVTLSALKQLGCLLVNIHGQHDNHALMRSLSHCFFLDQYAKNDKELLAYKTAYNEYLSVRSMLDKLKKNTEKKEEALELLRYEIDEIESIAPEEGEEDALKSERKALQNFEKIRSALENVCEILAKDNGADDLTREIKKVLSGIASFGTEYEELYNSAEMAYDAVASLSVLVRNTLGNLEYNRENLDRIEDRLDKISRLKRKYGYDVKDIIQYLENAKKQLSQMESAEVEEARLCEKLLLKEKEILLFGEALTVTRQKAAEDLEKAITEQLESLDMPNAEFRVAIEPCAPFENGCEHIEFLISANPGQDLRPISKAASGGELSRIMLSIKTVLASCDSVETLVFDEIDSGVSGATAEKIAKKMKEISLDKQVISVTHLAQIAAYADEHLLIDKINDGENTHTTVKTITGEDRVREIARIIGGEKLVPSYMESARELIAGAKI